MFRFSAQGQSAQAEECKDVLKNIGKLSLAGLFVAGTVLLSQAEAATVFANLAR